VTSYAVSSDGAIFDVVLQEAGPRDERCDLAELRERLLALGVAGETLRVRVLRARTRRVLVDTGPVDGFGWTHLVAAEGAYPADGGDDPTFVRADEHEIANEHLRVVVDAARGTYAVHTVDDVSVAGLGRLVDGGDGGDTYNYSPPESDVVVDAPEAVRVQVVERGPVRVSLLVETDYHWPTHAIGDERSCSARSSDRAPVTVATTLELRRGEPFVRVAHEFDNPSRDHRLRVHLPLPARVDGSDAECAFAVVHRGLTAEGGPQEFGLPTFPCRRFVDASNGTVGLAVVHDGLLEYEVVGDGTELAVTLLRAVGYLSRAEPALRPNPAGPLDPVRGAQMPGAQRMQYAVMPHRGDWRAADLYARADEFLVPLERVRGGGRAGTRPGRGQALRVDGAEVSAVLRVPGGLVVRVFRAAADPGPVTVVHDGVPARGWMVDLHGRPVEPFEGDVTLRPWQIATLALTP
jgi:hypothetical protein